MLNPSYVSDVQRNSIANGTDMFVEGQITTLLTAGRMFNSPIFNSPKLSKNVWNIVLYNSIPVYLFSWAMLKLLI